MTGHLSSTDNRTLGISRCFSRSSQQDTHAAEPAVVVEGRQLPLWVYGGGCDGRVLQRWSCLVVCLPIRRSFSGSHLAHFFISDTALRSVSQNNAVEVRRSSRLIIPALSKIIASCRRAEAEVKQKDMIVNFDTRMAARGMWSERFGFCRRRRGTGGCVSWRHR